MTLSPSSAPMCTVCAGQPPSKGQDGEAQVRSPPCAVIATPVRFSACCLCRKLAVASEGRFAKVMYSKTGRVCEPQCTVHQCNTTVVLS